MSWPLLLLLFVGALIALLFLRVPVAFAFLIVNLVALILMQGADVGISQMVLGMPHTLVSFALVPIPMFVLMGELLFHSGLATRTIDGLGKMLGKLPGRLGVLTMLSGTSFSVLSGSSLATTSMLSTLLIPEMRAKGYSKAMSAGPVLGAGGLAMIIPPSALAVLVGTIGQMSIGALLIAGIIPGLLLALFAIGYIITRAMMNPDSAPAYDVVRSTLGERLTALFRDVLPLLLVVVAVLGVIIFGWGTPTEAAVVGAVCSLLLVVAYRSMNWKVLRAALVGTIKISGMILLIIGTVSAYSRVLAQSGATRGLVDLVTSLNVAPILIIIAMLVATILLGAPLEQISVMLLTLPIFVPVVVELGYNPIWFGIMFLVAMDIGALTPPVGLALFVLKGTAPPDFRMGDVVRSAVPFIGVDIAVIATLLALPGLVTWLPDIWLG